MAGEGNWDPMDLVDHGIDFTTDSAVRWWGPWSPSGTWGAAGPAGLRLARILEELAAVDLSGWQGPAARAAGETLTGAAQLARVGGERVSAAALAARALDEAVREVLLRAAGAP